MEPDRMERTARLMRRDGLAALFCRLPQHVMMLTGYWPILGNSFCVVSLASNDTLDVRLAIPKAEADLVPDGAARTVMDSAGFGAAFTHGLGHGFGFQAINHAAAPILHPASDQILRARMVHNMEPAVYLPGQGGFRLNDDVLIREHGCERISADLPRDLAWLAV